MLRRSCCVLDDSNLKPLFDQFAQMRFDAHIGEHSAKDYFTDSTLAQLKYEVVCFWSPHAMWRDHDGLAHHVFCDYCPECRSVGYAPVPEAGYASCSIQDFPNGRYSIVFSVKRGILPWYAFGFQ